MGTVSGQSIHQDGCDPKVYVQLTDPHRLPTERQTINKYPGLFPKDPYVHKLYYLAMHVSKALVRYKRLD